MILPEFVFRITKEKWAGNLNGSGYAGRWNPNGIFMCYTAQSKALACLEMLVHLQTQELNHSFRINKIHIPKSVSCEIIDESRLIAEWKDFFVMDKTQEIGKNWILSHQSCLLRVPSALLDGEYNYLINPAHSDFQKIKNIEIEPFIFDSRLTKQLT